LAEMSTPPPPLILHSAYSAVFYSGCFGGQAIPAL